MADWILVGLALIGAIVGPYVGYRVAEGVNKRRWVEMDEIMARLTKYNEQQLINVQQATSDISRLQQQVMDHNKRDDDYFQRIEAMFREIRDALNRSGRP